MSTSRHNITRQRIIDAALDILSNLHFHEATVRKIAKRAGIAQGTVYKYFDSKEHLLSTTAAEMLNRMLEELNQHLLGLKGTLNKMRKMTWYYLSAYEKDWRIAWILYIGTPRRNWYELSEAWDKARNTVHLFVDILLEGVNAEEVGKDIDIRLITQLYFGTLANVTTHWLLRDRCYPLTGSADRISETVFSIIAAPKSHASFKCPFLIIKNGKLQPKEELDGGLKWINV